MALAAVAWAALLASLTPVPAGKTTGDSAAPVTIEVYSDFEGPASKAFHEDTLPRLEREFVAAAKVRLVYREFPLAQHVHAREAAAYAGAAAHLGLYRAVSDELFRSQAAWSVSGRVWDWVAGVLPAAERERVRTLAGSSEIAADLNRDLEAGAANGLGNAPMLVIFRGSQTHVFSADLNYILLEKFLNDLSK